ncbi:hypothetical protein F2Q69_00021578 [Brassica cretica]|uniref:Uncharacterized protein n=1 Tax=Brassica cretica TaxID=69181 RepID=A0A8S9Q5W3_BRACR|nr:hypothetical protein F2Q69_00021578 [Brassica cretica]
MDFKNIHAIPHMDHRDRNYPIDTMGVVFNTEAHFDDPASPRMVLYIRDKIDSQIKCVATGAHAYAFRDGLENMKGRGQVMEYPMEIAYPRSLTKKASRRGVEDAGSSTRAHEGEASTTIRRGLEHAGSPTRTHDETLGDDPMRVEATRVGADELYPSRDFALVEFRHLFRVF